MDKDLELYNNYLNGDEKAYETLYVKYKEKIKHFIYTIIKDYDKAEDIAQETFIYILKNKPKQEYSFKSYIYLVAKSRAINYINTEKRRNEINDTYLAYSEAASDDISEIVTKKEEKQELITAISMLPEKYRNAIYLSKIANLSYNETAAVLNESTPNVKNLIHRGKKELRKILIKRGFEEMNKVSKTIVIILIVSILLTGTVYALGTIYKHFRNNNITMNPTYKSTLNENTINNLWVGTLDLAWKDLTGKIGKKIELDEDLSIVNDLNESKFTKEMLDSNDYTINVERTVTNGYKIDAYLNKTLNFLESFDNFSDYNYTFGDGTEHIKYFGINNGSLESMNKNIEILFYNKISQSTLFSNDFAIKLKTKEGDEIILYRTDENKSFDEYYEDIENKSKAYTGNREFSEDDELLVPYVRVNGMISYDELYGKAIKNTDGLYIYDVIQNVNFSLNEKGCNLSSKVTMVTEYMGVGADTKFCYFKDNFVIFMKEANSNNPYFALKVDNDDILEKEQETDEPKIIDETMMKNADRYKVLDGEYKFYEDEDYEYFYPNQKTKIVTVYFKDGTIMTAEQALKEGKIKIDLLDEYSVQYFKKEK